MSGAVGSGSRVTVGQESAFGRLGIQLPRYVWYRVLWSSMPGYGVVWYGAVWRGMVLCGIVWCNVKCYGKVR